MADGSPRAAAPQRVCFELRVHPHLIEEYVARHTAVWPAMLRAIERSGRRNYSLFLRDDGMLIGYYEVDDDEASSLALALDPDSAEWEADAARFFVALDGDRIVGCVFALERADDFYVGKLAVDPDRQGQGIGRRLMRAVELLALNCGKLALELQTRIELTANHAAFARLGFHETGRTAHEGYARPTSISVRKALS